VISIRELTAADGPAVAEVRRASWQAAYTGIIKQALLDQAAAQPSGLLRPAPWRRTVVAVADGDHVAVGYAAFGPERSLLASAPIVPRAGAAAAAGQPPSAPRLTEAGLAGQVGEVYALYVAPDWWSTGTGRSLMSCAVAALTEAGYERAVLWVLQANARARRFYEKAGWAPDGASNILAGLGGVIEVRYCRPL